MSIQTAIDVNVECAIERGDYEKALRMRWASHANYSATVEPAELVDWIQLIRYAPEKDFRSVGK